MKRTKANYLSLHVLKISLPKLRKALISNNDRDFVNCIIECVLNVLNGNTTLTGCEKSKLSQNKLALSKLVDKQLSLQGKEGLIVQCRGIFLSLLAAVLPTLVSFIVAK